MFKLKSIIIKNFLSIQDASIDFSKPGLYLISGYNVKGGDSNGSGKSTILSAIAFALWGRTANGLQGESVANWDSNGEYNVTLDLVGPEGIYTIMRGKEGLEFTINNKSQKGRKRDVQELINETFHSTADIFFSSTLFTSNISDYLTKMGDAGKKKLFKSILRLDKLDAAYLKAKARYDAENLKATKADQRVSLYTDFTEAKQLELQTLNNQFDRYEDNRLSKIDTMAHEKTIKPEASSDLLFALKHKRNQFNKFNAQIDQKRDEREALTYYIQQAFEDLGTTKGKEALLEEDYLRAESLLDETECDKCGAPLGAAYNKRLIELREKFDKASSSRGDVENKIKNLEVEQRILESFLSTYEQLEVDVRTLEMDLQKEDEKIREWERENAVRDKSIQELKECINPYEELIKDAMVELQSHKENKKIAEKELKIASELMDVLAFLKYVFSREGVAAHIIELSFGSLQAIANMYLSKICSEGLLLSITPQRELKSKTLKEEIDIFITSVDYLGQKIPYSALSSGQQQRINIALLMALYKFCRNIGINDFDFIILDEVLDLSLAVKGQVEVIGLLRDLLQEVGQIIVVSHKESIAQDFDYEIQVRRDLDRISRIV